VVWLAIIFAVLYLLLSRWALPQVGAVLEMRANRIQADLQAAHAAKASADAAVAELTAATREAQATAQAEINSAVAAANEAAAAQAASLNARLEKQLAEAEQRIATARASAMGALRNVATDTASAVVTRLVGMAPATGAVEQAVDAALAARRG
jgi:F-type H+-transporting ATPase subunit b